MTSRYAGRETPAAKACQGRKPGRLRFAYRVEELPPVSWANDLTGPFTRFFSPLPTRFTRDTSRCHLANIPGAAHVGSLPQCGLRFALFA